GLPAGHLPVELRVTEQRGTAAVLAHLRGLALRLQAPAAHEAVAARDVEGNDHAVADGEQCHVRPDLDDLAHRLVPEDVPAIEERTQQLVQVQVRAADRGRGDADDRITGLLDHRVLDLVDPDVALSLPGECFHAFTLAHTVGGSNRVDKPSYRVKGCGQYRTLGHTAHESQEL